MSLLCLTILMPPNCHQDKLKGFCWFTLTFRDFLKRQLKSMNYFIFTVRKVNKSESRGPCWRGGRVIRVAAIFWVSALVQELIFYKNPVGPISYYITSPPYSWENVSLGRVKWTEQSHTGKRWQRWDLNPGWVSTQSLQLSQPVSPTPLFCESCKTVAGQWASWNFNNLGDKFIFLNRSVFLHKEEKNIFWTNLVWFILNGEAIKRVTAGKHIFIFQVV